MDMGGKQYVCVCLCAHVVPAGTQFTGHCATMLMFYVLQSKVLDGGDHSLGALLGRVPPDERFSASAIDACHYRSLILSGAQPYVF